ncbi:MAG: serine/threonine-protein kinase [Myxococcota bacterium]
MRDAEGPGGERLGRFRLLGRIARGGMAEIFLARPEDPDATDAGAEVAVKRLLPELRHDHEFLDMFRDEANLASGLDHPNVVRILEVGEEAELPFIAMELLRGVNLRDLASRLEVEGGQIPVELGLLIAIGALRGLAHAHEFVGEDGEPLQIVHRDVSPQNVIITYDGAIKLVDFGVAKAKGRLHRTRAGLIKGKFAYMSPEQVDEKPLDGRSDLFALAEVIYELLLRRHPFYAAADMEVLRRILDEDPPDPRELQPDFPDGPANILLRALSKLPEARFPSARAMEEALTSAWSTFARRPTSSDLAGFVRALFADRLSEEEQARRSGNLSALVSALQVGRALPRGMMTFASDDASPPPEPATQLAAAPPSAAGRGRRSRPESVRVEPAEADLGPRIIPSERARNLADPAETATEAELDAYVPGLDLSPPPRPSPPPPRPSPPRLDLVIFVSGMLALLLALVFAFAPGRGGTVAIRTVPTGAHILVDGVDTGLRTPNDLPYPTSGDVQVELVRRGFLPCTRRLSAADRARPLTVECQLRPEP